MAPIRPPRSLKIPELETFGLDEATIEPLEEPEIVERAKKSPSASAASSHSSGVS